MQICQDHWHELKNAIRQRGMWKLVSSNTGQQRPTQITKQMRATPPAGFDPLSMVSVMILDQARMAFGDTLEIRTCCPLCKVELNLGTGRSLEWIDVDADAILEVCRQQKLIGGE